MHPLMLAALSNALVATLLALLALVGGRLCRHRPALVHGLWLLVLLKLVTPPLVPVPVWRSSAPPSLPAPLFVSSAPLPAEEVVIPVVEGVERPPLADPVLPALDAPGADTPQTVDTSGGPDPAPIPGAAEEPGWRFVLPSLWTAGSLGWFALAGWRLNAFRRLLRHTVPAPEVVRDRVADLAARLRLSRCPEVRLVPGRLAPLLWAAGGRPLLLLPASLLERLEGDQLDALLTHELAHLRRRDHWVRYLELMVLGLYWWFPVAWLARRRLRAAEEECCDAWVVATLPGAGRAYATALVEVVDFVSEVPARPPVLASGLGEVFDLKRRLTMILRGTTRQTLGWGGALAVFGLGLLALSLAPSWGRAEDEPQPRKPEVFQEPRPAADPLQPPAPTPPPAAPGEKPPVREAVGRDNAELQAELVRLRAQVARSQAEVQAHQAELAVAQARLAQANAMLRERMAELERVQRESARAGVQPPRPGAMPPGPGDRGGNRLGSEQRIEELEKRLDEVLKELKELRRDLKPRPEGATPAPARSIPFGIVPPSGYSTLPVEP